MILFPEDITNTSPVGGKASALSALHLTDMNIPSWFVITPDAFHDSLTTAQRQQWDASIEHESLQAILQSLAPSASFQQALSDAVMKLAPNGERVAVRSSAAGEDGSTHSFAGQLESVLFVPAAQVMQRVMQVWRSGFSERIYLYYRENRLQLPPPAPAVIVQRMINADVAGVAFNADPVSGRRSVRVVGAVYGLGSALVSGDADADTYQVSRTGDIIQRVIADKRIRHQMDESAPEGVRIANVDSALAQKPALTDQQILSVARLSETASDFFGSPQDIEWAIEDGQLYLLQSRPVTALPDLPDPDGKLVIWDNSNIAESYRGITTPLTFSFARRSYEAVYREFCKMMRVPASVIARDDDTFGRMLGHIQGHVYYNLISWYRVLAMLPGFRINRGFMEQMMGVKQAMPDDVIAELAPPAKTLQKIQDCWRLLSTVLGLIANHFRLPGMIARFYQRLDEVLSSPPVPMTHMRADELMRYYRDLERQLLRQWDAPLVNDFFAMIFYGLLRKLASSWCNDHDSSLQNDLLIGEGDIISAEPAKRIKAMAQIALPNPALIDALTNGDAMQLAREIRAADGFNTQYRAYLEKFGDRCLDELKLESPTLHDDPLPLLRSIGHMAKRLQLHPESLQHNDDQTRLQANQRVEQALSSQPFRRLLFKWILKHTRARVSSRENLRFERTRIFGRVRLIIVEFGKRLHNLDLLDNPRDVFYLQIEELLGFAEGTSATTNLRVLCAQRKREFACYETSAAPATRFETHGMVYHAQNYQGAESTDVIHGESAQGIGCCPGIVRGRVRVVRDPRGAELQQGEILVAERTDPGWIMLFPAAAGLLVEHGSLLSHSAIVAREMGIPAVVALSGVTSWLQSGDWVEMDGRSGSVRKIQAPESTHD
jgi:rifampicin phosphotransferase